MVALFWQNASAPLTFGTKLVNMKMFDFEHGLFHQMSSLEILYIYIYTYTRVKVDGTLTMHWFNAKPCINLPFGDGGTISHVLWPNRAMRKKIALVSYQSLWIYLPSSVCEKWRVYKYRKPPNQKKLECHPYRKGDSCRQRWSIPRSISNKNLILNL